MPHQYREHTKLDHDPQAADAVERNPPLNEAVHA
jgi:hypothetical protein